MERALTVHLPGQEPVRRELPAPVSAGGSRADGLLLPGAPPAALRLVPVAAGVVVEAGASGVRVAGHAVAPGARRLLRPGERVELAGSALALPAAPAPEATRAAASPVLRGELGGEGAAVVVLTGPRAGVRQPLGTGLTAGRGRAAALRVPDPLASRVHLRLRPTPDGATVEDLGSKNGVRLNGVPLDRRPCPVRPGDEIALGETVLCLEDPWAGGPPAAAPIAPDGSAPAATTRATPLARVLAAALLLAISAASLALAAS